jgi:hypothetical protein
MEPGAISVSAGRILGREGALVVAPDQLEEAMTPGQTAQPRRRTPPEAQATVRDLFARFLRCQDAARTRERGIGETSAKKCPGWFR